MSPGIPPGIPPSPPIDVQVNVVNPPVFKNIPPCSHVHVMSSSTSPSSSVIEEGPKCLFINTKAKTNFLSWLRPVHKFIRSKLLQCLSANNKESQNINSSVEALNNDEPLREEDGCLLDNSSNVALLQECVNYDDIGGINGVNGVNGVNNDNNRVIDRNVSFANPVCEVKVREFHNNNNCTSKYNRVVDHHWKGSQLQFNRTSQDVRVVDQEFVGSQFQSINTSNDVCTANQTFVGSHNILVNRIPRGDVNKLRKELGHICQVSDTIEVGSVPFVKAIVFDDYYYFCIDSGAAVSVLGRDFLPHVNLKQLQRFAFQLKSANNSNVKVFGKLKIPITIGSYTFDHIFVVADVAKNFLGADFLSKFNLWFNMDKGVHIDASTPQRNEVTLSQNSSNNLFFISLIDKRASADDADGELMEPSTSQNYSGDHLLSTPIVGNDDNSSIDSDSEYDNLLQQFCDLRTNFDVNTLLINDDTYADDHLLKKDVISKDVSAKDNCVDSHIQDQFLKYLKLTYPTVFSGEISMEIKHDITMEIEINGNFKRPYIYTVPYCYKKAVRERLDELLSKGIIRRSSSDYMNPITVVPKKDGSVRVCGDYRALNAVTRSDRFTLPRIDYIKSHIRGRVFTTLDLKDGFFQVPMQSESVAKTAIYTEFGLYEYVRMPFGLKNAPSVFQRFVDLVFHDLREFTHVYIDDVIIFSQNISEHINHLERVIKRLSEYGLTIQERKCYFFLDKIQYLGFEFDVTGYRPLPRVLPQFSAYPVPVDKKSVQKFLGAVNFYRSHIPDLATIAAPIYELLKKNKKFLWTEQCQRSFQLLCKILSSRITLVPFNDDGNIILQTDASSVALGAVLLQDGNPVEFYSRKLSSVEQRYPTYEREAAAMVAAMLHFRPFLIGRYFELYTDHRPLLAWKSKMPESKRQARLWVKVQDLDYDIKYIRGEDNVLADLMSRPPGEQMSSYSELYNDVTLNGMALSLLTEELLQAQTKEFIQSCNVSAEHLQYIDKFAYIVDKGYPRLIIPPEFRESLVSSIHGLGHFGRRRTLRAVAMLYWWKGMPSYVANYVRCCEACQRNKPCKKVKRQPVRFFASARFKIVHMDFVGPFKPSNRGNNYLFTLMDRYSRWIEAIPMRDPTAQSTAQVFMSQWVCRYGIPEAILTDQGGQFESQLFNEVLNKLGITRSRTTAYHPETNGALERAHGTLKNCLRCLVSSSSDWEERLPLALFAMRTALFDNELSPSLVLYGEQIHVPSAFLSVDPNMFDESMSNFMTNLTVQLNEIRAIILETQKPLQSNDEDIQQQKPFNHSFVYIKDPIKRSSLEPKWLGPFKVLHSSGPVIRVNVNGIEKNINIDRVKPAYTLSSYFEEDLNTTISDNPEFLYPEESFTEYNNNNYVDEFQEALNNQPMVLLNRIDPPIPVIPRRSQRLEGNFVQYSS